MRLVPQNPGGNGFTKLASFVIIAAVLYLAKEVFVPIALAILLSFLLAPLVIRLSRWGCGKVLSVLLTVSFAFTIIAIIGWLVTAQIIQLAAQLPQYQENVRAKIIALKTPQRNGVLYRATGVVRELQKELESAAPAEAQPPATPSSPAAEKPVPVELKPSQPNSLQVIASMAAPVLKPLATAGAVVFFVVLMLFKREDLRERFLMLVSGGELNVATQAVDDATQRVSRYLVMQLVVNATYGIPIGIGLYFIGVPNAFLWGLLATLLRFIPFIGPWIAAAFPIALAFAVDPGWAKPILTIGLFLFVELVSNNVIEPWLYGASTGVSNIALLMAAIFWTWLWGAVGLLLSAPLTVCLLVLGKYVPGLRFLSILLGSDPVLDPEARFYQRMLAMDEDELGTLADDFRQKRSLGELYDNVIIPALILAEQDRHKGALAEMRQAFIVQTTRELIDTLGEREVRPNPENEGEENPPEPLRGPVLCIAARDEVDELASLMLAQLLGKRGIDARAVPAKTVAPQWFKQITQDRISTVCISSVPPFAVAPARQACRRLKQQFPHLTIIAGIWNIKAQPSEFSARFGPSAPDAIVTRLEDAVTRLEAVLESGNIKTAPAPAHSASPRQRAISAAPPPAAEPEEIFAAITRQTATILDVPVSLVTILPSDTGFWDAHGGVPPELASGAALRESAVCKNGSLCADILTIEDTTKDERFSGDPLFRERGVRFYVGVPLRTSEGELVGALCVTDTEPHQVSERAKTLLRNLAARLVEKIQQRPGKPAPQEPVKGDAVADLAVP